MESEFFKTNSHLIEESIKVRDSILALLDEVHHDRQYLNKHFQNSIVNYFLRKFMFPLLGSLENFSNSQDMNIEILKKYRNTEGPKYIRLINGYFQEVTQNNILYKYRNSLTENILSDKLEIPTTSLCSNKELQALVWKKAFCLFLLYHSFNRNIKGIFEIWSSLFPETKILRKRKQNVNHVIFIPERDPVEVVSQEQSNKEQLPKVNPFQENQESFNVRQNYMQEEFNSNQIQPSTEFKQKESEQLISEYSFKLQYTPEAPSFLDKKFIKNSESSIEKIHSNSNYPQTCQSSRNCKIQKNKVQNYPKSEQSILKTSSPVKKSPKNKNFKQCGSCSSSPSPIDSPSLKRCEVQDIVMSSFSPKLLNQNSLQTTRYSSLELGKDSDLSTMSHSNNSIMVPNCQVKNITHYEQ